MNVSLGHGENPSLSFFIKRISVVIFIPVNKKTCFNNFFFPVILFFYYYNHRLVANLKGGHKNSVFEIAGGPAGRFKGAIAPLPHENMSYYDYPIYLPIYFIVILFCFNKTT